jgi:hypothetical protein
MIFSTKQRRNFTVVDDPRIKPLHEDEEDLEGDVHEEIPYETERFSRGHMPESIFSPNSLRSQKHERNQVWSREL